jgi:hypothetical protein
MIRVHRKAQRASKSLAALCLEDWSRAQWTRASDSERKRFKFELDHWHHLNSDLRFRAVAAASRTCVARSTAQLEGPGESIELKAAEPAGLGLGLRVTESPGSAGVRV